LVAKQFDECAMSMMDEDAIEFAGVVTEFVRDLTAQHVAVKRQRALQIMRAQRDMMESPNLSGLVHCTVTSGRGNTNRPPASRNAWCLFMIRSAYRHANMTISSGWRL